MLVGTERRCLGDVLAYLYLVVVGCSHCPLPGLLPVSGEI